MIINGQRIANYGRLTKTADIYIAFHYIGYELLSSVSLKSCVETKRDDKIPRYK